MALRASRGVLVVSFLLVAGCGGTWDDDPGNWQRAFGSTKPSNVAVLHSKYWRSAHWSYEFQYFFEIAANETLKNQFVATNNLRLATATDAERIKSDIVGEVPRWFAPKEATGYEVWATDETADRNMVLLIDRQSGHLFVTDYLV